MSEMVERVAAEIRRQCGKVTDDSWEELAPRAKARWCKRAVAVIAALREPTEAIANACIATLGSDDDRPTGLVFLELWTAGIDAARGTSDVDG